MYHKESSDVMVIRIFMYSKIRLHVIRLPTFRSNVLCVLFGLCCSCKNALVRPTRYRNAVYVKYVHMCCRDGCEGLCHRQGLREETETFMQYQLHRNCNP